MTTPKKPDTESHEYRVLQRAETEANALLEYKNSLSATTFELNLHDSLEIAYQVAGCIEVEEIGWGEQADMALATLGAAYVAQATELGQLRAQGSEVARLARAYVQLRESGGTFPDLHRHYNELRKAVLTGGEG